MRQGVPNVIPTKALMDINHLQGPTHTTSKFAQNTLKHKKPDKNAAALTSVAWNLKRIRLRV